jgi:hypothetical protein
MEELIKGTTSISKWCSKAAAKKLLKRTPE